MYCLTKTQQEMFELYYQDFAPNEPWALAGLFSGGNAAYKMATDIMPEVFNKIFKVKGKNTRRLDIAYHEAGHAVVIAACSGKISTAWIDSKNPNKRKSLGNAAGAVESGNCQDDDDNETHDIVATIPLPVAVLSIMSSCSGFVGERFLTDHRVHSAFHERFLVYCQTRYLDDQDGKAPLTNWEYYTRSAREIIWRNDDLLWHVADDLLENGILSEDAKARLHSRIIKPPAAFFFEEMDIIKHCDKWRHPWTWERERRERLRIVS